MGALVLWGAVTALPAHAQGTGTITPQIRSVAGLFVVAVAIALLVAAWISSLRSKVTRRESSLANSVSRYERIFAESPAANFVSTPDGRLLTCNANYVRLLGFASIEAACAVNALSVYPDPRDREVMVDELRHAGRLVGKECKFRRVDGSIVEVQENVVGVFDENGELTELHGFMLDLTEQRRLEYEFRQAQKMEAIGRLAGGVAHDFNNLLTVILASSDLALETLEPGHEVRADIEDIRSAGRRAVELTGQLLSFSRRQVLQEAVVDVSKIVGGLGSMVRRLVGADVAIDVALPSPALRPTPVFVDPHQLEQALLNLAVNAKDAMPSGGVLQFSVEEVALDQAWVALNEGARAGRFCRIQVRDSGCGMDAVTRTRSFEPFFTTKPIGKGTGLGLSMVFGFIKQSGGYVTIDSAPHAGTTVSLYLPVAHVTDIPSLPEERDIAAAPPAERRRSGCVLIVEDEAQVRAVAARVIAALGFDVLVAASAREAATLGLTVNSLALVLTDVVMPNGGGLEVAEEMQVQFPGVPVIYMSGYMEDDKVLRSVRTARHQLIGKPFTPASLTAAVIARARSVEAAPERDQLYSRV